MNEKIFFPEFFSNFFSKFFCQNFPQNCFGIYFEGFAQDTRVLRAPHAGFFSWLYQWENFFPRIFSKIFFQFFFPNFIVKIFLKIVLGFISRGSRETHACCEHPTRDFSCDYMNEKTFFPQNFFQDFFLKNSWIIRKFRELLMNYSWIIHDYSWISHEFSQFFSPEFFPKFFSNFFSQILLSKFSSKLFWDLFRGVRARHTRVASTPRGIFLVIIWMRKLFFPRIFFKIFSWKIHELFVNFVNY